MESGDGNPVYIQEIQDAALLHGDELALWHPDGQFNYNFVKGIG